jgi:hypothetical protein
MDSPKRTGSRTRLAQNAAEVISSGRTNWSPVPVSKATSDSENAISAGTPHNEVTTFSGIGNQTLGGFLAGIARVAGQLEAIDQQNTPAAALPRGH